MSVAALDSHRLTLIALVPDDAVSVFGRFQELPRFGDVHHIVVKSRTAADRGAVTEHINSAVLASERAVMLLAQGSACAAAAWWARLSPKAFTANVAGALLAAPESADLYHRSFMVSEIGLPFPSIVVGADDEAQRLGTEWGSRLIDGPLLSATTAPTNRLRAIIERFTSAVVNRDVAAAYRMIHAIGDA